MQRREARKEGIRERKGEVTVDGSKSSVASKSSFHFASNQGPSPRTRERCIQLPESQNQLRRGIHWEEKRGDEREQGRKRTRFRIPDLFPPSLPFMKAGTRRDDSSERLM